MRGYPRSHVSILLHFLLPLPAAFFASPQRHECDIACQLPPEPAPAGNLPVLNKSSKPAHYLHRRAACAVTVSLPLYVVVLAAIPARVFFLPSFHYRYSFALLLLGCLRCGGQLQRLCSFPARSRCHFAPFPSSSCQDCILSTLVFPL